MKRISLIFYLLLSLTLNAGAQEVYKSSGNDWAKPKPQKEGGFDPQRLIFGGSLWVTFSGYTSVYVAPVVGYRISDRFAAGMGLAYEYVHDNDALYIQNAITGTASYYDYNASLLAPSVWGRAMLFANLFAHAEFEYNFVSYSDIRYDPNGSGNIEDYKVKYQFPAMLLGGGYRQPITENSSMYMMALYDVIQDPRSMYYNTIDFRIGFNVGF